MNLASLLLMAASFAARPTPPAPQAIAPVTAAEVKRLHAELIPVAPQPWETISWRTDLLAACDEARRTARPLFLWSMNGHPLGCV